MKTLKTFLLLVWLTVCVSVRGQVVVSGPITNNGGAFPVATVNGVKGAPQIVATMAALSNQPSWLRATGQLTHVLSPASDWRLVGGTNNANWQIVLPPGVVQPSGGDDTVLLTTAVLGGGEIELSVGTFLLTNTIVLPSGTVFRGAGPLTILKKATDYGHVFANSASYAYGTNSDENIELADFTINCNSNGTQTLPAMPSANGHIQFTYCSNLKVSNLLITNGASQLFAVHLQNCTNVLAQGLDIDGWKDGVHISAGCNNVTVENCNIRTGDDAIAMTAVDYPRLQNSAQDINFVTIRNCTLHEKLAGGGHVAVYIGSWTNWQSGSTYLYGHLTVNAGKIYKQINSLTNVASIAPTHTIGDVTGADGATWRFLESGTNLTANINHVLIDNVSYDNVSGNNQFEVSAYGSTANNYSVYPGTEGQARITDFRFAGVRASYPIKYGESGAGGLLNLEQVSVGRRLFVDDNYVGIGITNPAQALDVVYNVRVGQANIPDGEVTIVGNAGGIQLRGVAGGTVPFVRFVGNAGTLWGGFYGYGSSDVFSRLFVGKDFDEPWQVWLPDGKVGIGTVTPGTLLDVAGHIRGEQLTVVSDNATNSLVTFADAIGDQTPFVIRYDGNVGLGNTNPASRLVIRANGNSFDEAIVLEDNGVNTTFSVTDNGTVNIAGSIKVQTGPAYLMLRDSGSGKLTLQSDASYSALINPAGGNVGIGTTSPTEKFEVIGAGGSGGIRVQGRISTVLANSVTLQVNEGSGAAVLTAVGPDAGTRGTLNFRLTTGVGGSQIDPLFIDTIGNVGIGTTTPGSKLDVAGDIRASTTINATNGFGIGANTINSWDDVTNYFSLPVGGSGTNRYYEAGEAFHWVEVGGTNGDPYGIKGASASETASSWSVSYGGNFLTDGNITAQGSLNITSGAQLDSTLTVGDTLTVGAGVNADGGGLKHGRVTTGSIAGLASAAVTLTWATPFANANYTVTCDVVEADATVTTLRKHHIESQTASAVVVRVINDHTTDSKTGILHVMAIHD